MKVSLASELSSPTYPDYPNCIECKGNGIIAVPNCSNIFPRYTQILFKPCNGCYNNMTAAVADIQQQLASLANDPNLTIITHHELYKIELHETQLRNYQIAILEKLDEMKSKYGGS